MKENETTTTLLAAFGGVLLVPVMILYSAFSWGYCALKTYYWLLVPNIENLPEISFVQAVGIMMLANVLTNNSRTYVKKEYKDEAAFWLQYIFGSWLTLFGVWLISLFI